MNKCDALEPNKSNGHSDLPNIALLLSPSPMSYLHYRTTVKSGALTQLRQSVSLGDFLLAPARPVDLVRLWNDLLCLTPGENSDEGFVKDKTFWLNWNRTRDTSSRPSKLSTKLSLYLPV